MSASLYALVSVIAVSAISLVGVLTLSFTAAKLKYIVFVLVAFAAGTIVGDVFFHLLPEVVKDGAFTIAASIGIISGIIFLFILEKVIHWRHCHYPASEDHPHPFAVMNLIGDAFHNFLDGVIIATSYMVSIPVGIATTIAVIVHEIPQEMGDIGVLLHGGFSRRAAIGYNVVSAIGAVLGVIITLVFFRFAEGVTDILVPFTIGTFLYIAGSDLIPELHKELAIKRSIAQLFAFVIGVTLMGLLLFME